MKKTILFSGYFSTDYIVKNCVDLGHDCYTMHPLSGTIVETGATSLSEEYSRYTAKAIELMDSERSSDLKDFIYRLSQSVTIGGMQLLSLPLFDLIAYRGVSSFFVDVIAKFDFFKEFIESRGCDAIVLHNTDLIFSKLAEIFDVPLFCVNNGTVSNAHMTYNSKETYNTTSNFYLHGEYDVDWLRQRNKGEDINYVISGNPSFDGYYEASEYIKKDRFPNVFMYSMNNVLNTMTATTDDKDYEILYHMIDFPMLRFCLPFSLDYLFINAFARFQKEVPDAELWVTLRPYSSYSSKALEEALPECGITNAKVFNHHTSTPFRELIQRCSCYIGGVSTTIIESVLTRTPTILIHSDLNENEFNLRALPEWCLKARINEDSIIEALKLIMEKGVRDFIIDGCDKVSSYYNYDDDGRASIRITEDIIGRI